MKAENFTKGLRILCHYANVWHFYFEENTYENIDDMPTEPINDGKVVNVYIAGKSAHIVSQLNGVTFDYLVGEGINDEVFFDYLLNELYDYNIDTEEYGEYDGFVNWYGLDRDVAEEADNYLEEIGEMY